MNLIQCALNCVYQKEGYCGLESATTVNSIKSECPHYKKLSYKRKSFTNTANSNKSH